MKGAAIANGAGTIINAIAGYKGAAYATTQKTKAKIELTKQNKEIKGDAGPHDPELIEKTVKKTLKYYNKEYGAKIRTKSNIPVARGLKSSSAAANAAALATIDALDIKRNNQEILEIAIKAAKEANVTITGAYDDATASLLGGITITDNKNNQLLQRKEMKQQVLILVPENQKQPTKELDPTKPRLLTKEVKKIHELAKKGHIHEAMNLNGIIYTTTLDYSPEIIFEALEAGAESSNLSGTGPAYTAFVEEETKQEVKKQWNQHGKVIETRINNQGARII